MKITKNRLRPDCKVNMTETSTETEVAELMDNLKGIIAYVAGRYSGDIAENIAIAEEVSIKLIRNGFSVYTPHKNCSGYEKYEDESITVDTWYRMGLNILLRCDLIYVMKDSEESIGTQVEIEYAQNNMIPVLYEIDFPPEQLMLEDAIRAKYGMDSRVISGLVSMANPVTAELNYEKCMVCGYASVLSDSSVGVEPYVDDCKCALAIVDNLQDVLDGKKACLYFVHKSRTEPTSYENDDLLEEFSGDD